MITKTTIANVIIDNNTINTIDIISVIMLITYDVNGVLGWVEFFLMISATVFTHCVIYDDIDHTVN